MAAPPPASNILPARIARPGEQPDPEQVRRNKQDTAYAIVRDSEVRFTNTNPGSGYSSPPEVSIAGMGDLRATATLSFDPNFSKNGSIQELTAK